MRDPVSKDLVQVDYAVHTTLSLTDSGNLSVCKDVGFDELVTRLAVGFAILSLLPKRGQ